MINMKMYSLLKMDEHGEFSIAIVSFSNRSV